jgi:hypothetical protein
MLQSGVPFWWGEPKNEPVSTNRWRIPYSGDMAAGIYFFGGLRTPSSYVPEAGDIVFFTWNDGNVPYDHVGIVTHVTPSTVTTVEGNAGNEPNSQTVVKQRTWARNSSNILAYGRWPN